MPLKDPTLEHQINLVFDQDARVVVTCNCWKQNVKATAFKHHFGHPATPAEAWRRYNDPSNHRGQFTADPAMLDKYGCGVKVTPSDAT